MHALDVHTSISTEIIIAGIHSVRVLETDVQRGITPDPLGYRLVGEVVHLTPLHGGRVLLDVKAGADAFAVEHDPLPIGSVVEVVAQKLCFYPTNI